MRQSAKRSRRIIRDDFDGAWKDMLKEKSSNPFARFVAAQLHTLDTQGDYETRLELKLRVVKALYNMGFSEKEIEDLSHSFDWLLRLPPLFENQYADAMIGF